MVIWLPQQPDIRNRGESLRIRAVISHRVEGLKGCREETSGDRDANHNVFDLAGIVVAESFKDGVYLPCLAPGEVEHLLAEEECLLCGLLCSRRRGSARVEGVEGDCRVRVFPTIRIATLVWQGRVAP